MGGGRGAAVGTLARKGWAVCLRARNALQLPVGPARRRLGCSFASPLWHCLQWGDVLLPPNKIKFSTQGGKPVRLGGGARCARRAACPIGRPHWLPPSEPCACCAASSYSPSLPLGLRPCRGMCRACPPILSPAPSAMLISTCCSGSVYRGLLSGVTPCAIKVFNFNEAGSAAGAPGLVRLFIQEALTMRRLRHPNVVNFYGVSLIGGCPALSLFHAGSWLFGPTPTWSTFAAYPSSVGAGCSGEHFIYLGRILRILLFGSLPHC